MARVLREERLEFYRAHSIGFVARPPHGAGGFERAGRFKKASNMNYCLDISRRVEQLMAVRPHLMRLSPACQSNALIWNHDVKAH